MLQIGLTGMIGAGKSTLGRLLRERGCAVLDADSEAHALYARNAGLREKLARTFGAAVLTEAGVDRRFLASCVFSDAASLAVLEKMVYPVLQEYLESAIRDCRRALYPPPAVVVEAALLFKWPDFSRKMDQIWIVEAPEAVRLERLVKRGLSPEDAQRRMALQRENPFPQNACYVHFDNGGDVPALERQLPGW